MDILVQGMHMSLCTAGICSEVPVLQFPGSHHIALYNGCMYLPAEYMDFQFPQILANTWSSRLLSIFLSDEQEILSHCFNFHFPDFPERLSIVSYVIICCCCFFSLNHLFIPFTCFSVWLFIFFLLIFKVLNIF
uniref:Uncharacterized protein n=1 Tax=Rousettus aegyptiacus TaxID=9407 RepID=A0A7J8H138_ROUAE|nr:hypothetical protein HJG63_011319 [Rousettus aegyptiacus]